MRFEILLCALWIYSKVDSKNLVLLYLQPLQYREDLKRKQGKLKAIGYWGEEEEPTHKLVRLAQSLSAGL